MTDQDHPAQQQSTCHIQQPDPGRHLSGRKIHAMAKLKLLPIELQDEIAEFGSKSSLRRTAAWLEKQGIFVCLKTISDFLQWHRLRHLFRYDADVVKTLIDEMQQMDPSLSPDQIHRAGQLFFSRRAISQEDPQLWKLTQELRIKNDQLELDREKQREQLHLQKTASKRDLTEKANGGLDPETLAQLEKQLKLM